MNKVFLLRPACDIVDTRFSFTASRRVSVSGGAELSQTEKSLGFT